MHLAVEPDHIHLFLDCPQHLAISQIVFRLKGYTSRILRKEFEHLRRMPSMWTTSYFASTAGAVSEQTIAKYINSQGTRVRFQFDDSRQDHLNVAIDAFRDVVDLRYHFVGPMARLSLSMSPPDRQRRRVNILSLNRPRPS